MEIERFEFQPEGINLPNPSVTGFNIIKIEGKTCVNLFVLDENKGAPISEHLWPVAKQVSEQVLMGEKPENVEWSLNCGNNTCLISFSTINDQLYKIDLTNKHVIQVEIDYLEDVAKDGKSPYTQFVWPLEKYQSEYSKGQWLYNAKHDHKQSSWETHFVSACPDAKGGLFYLACSYYYDEDFNNRCEFILSDTRKLISKFSYDDPEAMYEGVRAFEGDDVNSALEANSIQNPCKMPVFCFNDFTAENWEDENGSALGFYEGFHSRLVLIQKLDLPFVPVTVFHKNLHDEPFRKSKKSIEMMDSVIDAISIGFKDGDDFYAPDMAPIYE